MTEKEIIKRIRIEYKRCLKKINILSVFVRLRIRKGMENNLWGSALNFSIFHQIDINLNLIMKFPHQAEYVVAHEMAHVSARLKGEKRPHGKIWEKECLRLGVLPIVKL